MMANDFYKDFEELEDLIEDAFHIPLFKGKVILDESRFFDIMDNIRQSLPVELKQAKEVIANKETMMNRVKEDSDIMKEKARKAAEQMLVKAKKNSDAMIARAQAQADALVNEQEIMVIARERASETVDKAKTEAARMRTAAVNYVTEILGNSEDQLRDALSAVEKAKSQYEGQ